MKKTPFECIKSTACVLNIYSFEFYNHILYGPVTLNCHTIKNMDLILNIYTNILHTNISCIQTFIVLQKFKLRYKSI